MNTIPELWNTTEVARFLGIKPTSVSAYRIRGQMPPPVQTVGKQTHLWDADTIRAWHAQRPGTPESETSLTKRHPADWSKTLGITVVDPDGWRADGAPWDRAITQEEFRRRAAMSTVSELVEPDLDVMSEQERAAYYEENVHRLDELFDTDNPVQFERSEVKMTNYAVAPGEYITEWLEEQHTDPTLLAWRLGVPDAYVAHLLAGKIALSQPLQAALADITGIPVDSWARLDTQYWKDKARLEGQ